MKRQFLGVIILVLMNCTIVTASRFLKPLKMNIMNEEDDFIQNTPLYDVNREIQNINEEFYNSPKSFLQSSPLNENNITAKFSSVQNIDDDPIIVNIDLEKNIIKRNEVLDYSIQVTQGLLPLAGRTFQLDIIKGEYWEWYYSYYWINDPSKYNARIIETKQITTGTNGEYISQFVSNINGRFTIVIKTLDGQIQRTRSFTVANIALFWRISSEFISGEPHYSIAYVLNTTDFSPVPSAAVSLSGTTYDYGYHTESLFLGQTNSEGVVEISFIPSDSLSINYNFLANLSATFNEETVYISRDLYRGGYYWGWDGYSEFEPYEFIITTDKTIYTPGETIKTRILVWKNDYFKVSKEPIRTSFDLEFLSPTQHILLKKELETNAYGIITYSFPLDTDSELGNYIIIAKKDNTLASLKIRVDKYEKPAFKLILSLDQEYIAPGKTIHGNITAEYYFGKPVSNSEIELEIDDFTVYNGITDMNGYWEFKFVLPSKTTLKDRTTITINATVTDTIGRTVESSALLQVSDKIYVWSYINPWYPIAGENITINFGSYQYCSSGWGWWMWKPIAEADVKIKLYGILKNGIISYITTLSSKLNSDGYGQIKFDLSEIILNYYSRFLGLVEIDAKDGRKGSSTFYFSVDINSIEITLNSDTFETGDLVKSHISMINKISGSPIEGTIRIRIFDPDYDLIGQETLNISSKGENFNFKLSSYAPTGKYIIYIYIQTIVDYQGGSWSYYRYSKTLEFFVGTAYELSLQSNQKSYCLSESIIISGTLNGNTNAPLMIQIVKKGIISTEYISPNKIESFNIKIEEIGILAPKFWVYSFAILTDGNILETIIELEIDPTLLININSDKEVYEPGDSAKISIEVFDAKNQPISSIIAVSFIDSSVYGVEPDPEHELEHFENSDYWPSVWTVTSWKNQQNYWWFWWYEDNLIVDLRYYSQGGFYSTETVSDEYVSSKNQQNDQIPEIDKKHIIRDNLPENAYWSPRLVVESGKIEFDLTLPDNIGEWTVRSVITTKTGQGVLHKHSFKTFLPFFVEIEKEPFVLQDDVFLLKGIVYNYLDELVDITLDIEADNGVLVLGSSTQKMRLPSGFLGSIGWSCLAKEVGFFNITLHGKAKLFNGTIRTDAIRKPIEIIPNGLPSEFKMSGFIFSDPSFSYYQYAEAVKKSAFIEISLGLGSIALTSWERLIGYPYGCTEQTISRLIPNALILEYLEETGQLTNKTKEILNDMILSGLSRLYSLRHIDGGWGWWDKDESQIYMTSLVLYGLGIINHTSIYIDSSIVETALEVIKINQNYDGSWTPDSWRNIDKTSFTTFVLRSIIPWENLLSKVDPIIAAIDYIHNSWDDENQRSTYLAGLYLDTILGTDYTSSFDTLLLTYLRNEVLISSEGYYWSYADKDHSWWRSLGGNVEITALALKALAKINPAESFPIIRGGIQWLLQKQSIYGWGNTADTAAALSAIIDMSRSAISSNENTEVTLVINENIIGSYYLTSITQPSVYLDLKDYLVEGNNNLTLLKQGSGNVSYYFYGSQNLRSLPSIDIPPEINTTPNHEIFLTISLTPLSSIVFASNIIISPLTGDISPIIIEPKTISLLTQKNLIVFSYHAPTKIGTYSINGFEISFQLSDINQTIFSPGIITRRYGPIQLNVIEQVESFLNTGSTFNNKEISSVKTQIKTRETISSPDFILKRVYSKFGTFHKGDVIYVTLSITNNKQKENFLMVEEMIPIGFEIDKTSIKHPGSTYKFTSSGLTFFFPEMETGTTLIQYCLIAINIRQSLVTPAKLSSMYDDWMVFSSSAVLGDTRILIDPKTGKVIQDKETPILNLVSFTETTVSSKVLLKAVVNASDNWGIASVRIFIKQSDWFMFECFESDFSWNTYLPGVKEGQSQIYIELIDYAGNVLVSEEFLHYFTIKDLVIPIIPILGLLVFALFTGFISSQIVRKKKF